MHTYTKINIYNIQKYEVLEVSFVHNFSLILMLFQLIFSFLPLFYVSHRMTLTEPHVYITTHPQDMRLAVMLNDDIQIMPLDIV